MHSIEEKRVYGDQSGATNAYVASATGVVSVRLSGDAVGEFSLLARGEARDLAVSETGHLLAVATPDDVLVCRLAGAGDGDSSADADAAVDGDTVDVSETGFGSAVAVGVDGDDLLAAGPDGRLAWATVGARTADPPADSNSDSETDLAETVTWTSLSADQFDAVRAIDGDLVGTDDGVYRRRDGRLEHAGLTDVHDVSAAGIPLAATDDGLYKLGNGWMTIHEDAGPFDCVDADAAAEFGRLERAHAVAGETMFELGADGEWRSVSLPDPVASGDDRVVAVAYGESVYAVTEGGRLLARRDALEASGADAVGPDRWRVHTIGVTNAATLECGPAPGRSP